MSILFPCVWVSIKFPFCVCVSKSSKMDTDWHKSHFSPTATATHHQKTFLVSNERYGQNKTFLLRCYGIYFAPIKRYHPFCFLWLYIRRQRLSLYDLSQLSVIYLSVCFVFFLSVCVLFLFVGCLLFLFLVHLYFFFLYYLFIIKFIDRV